MVDPGRVRKLLGRMADRRERLAGYGDRDRESYLGDDEAVAASPAKGQDAPEVGELRLAA